MLIWEGTDEWRAEAAHVQPEEDRFGATGVQLGVGPVPYRLDYELETTATWVTRVLHVTASGEGWRRSLRLARDGQGRWTSTATSDGQVDLPVPGCAAGTVDGALDCDLGLSPLTNAMPILRHQLHQSPGAVECAMAWVSVPDLAVHRSVQHYQHLRTEPDGAVVRFTSGDFTAELVVDTDGFVVDYPDLARRISGPPPAGR
jgi:hypothetical protein